MPTGASFAPSVRTALERQVSTQSTRLQPSLEFTLLTLCVQSDHLDFTVRELNRILARDLDWERFLFLAAKNQVVPLVYSCLNSFASQIPTDVVAKLRRRCAGIASWNLSLAAELNVLLQLFEEHGIRAIPFKGPVFAIALYGQLSLRQGDDLDIFVEPDQLGRAIRLLEGLGYRIAPELARIPARDLLAGYKDIILEHPSNGICVELHWSLCEPAFSHNLRSFNLCQRQSRTIKVLDSLVPIASPEDMLFLLSVHGMRHYWNCLKWICDITRLPRAYPDLDWESSLKIADSFSCRRAFLLPHTVASHLLDTPLPIALRAAADNDPALPALVNRIIIDLSCEINRPFPISPQLDPFSIRSAEMDISQKVFRVRSKDSLAERLLLFFRLVRDFIRPDESDLIASPFLSKLTFVFWIVQPVRLFRGYGFRFVFRVSRDLLIALVR